MVLSMEETIGLVFSPDPSVCYTEYKQRKLNKSRETNQKTIVMILARDDGGLN